MEDGLGALGQGLQAAGAILSPEVYDTQIKERQQVLPNLLRTMELTKQKRILDADAEFAKQMGGLQPGALNDSASLLDNLRKLPPTVLAESPRAQAMLGMASTMQQREATQALAKQRLDDAKEARTQAMQQRYDQLELQRQHYEELAGIAQQNVETRRAAQEATERLGGMMAQIRADALRDNIALRRETLNLKREQVGAATQAKTEKVNAPVEDLVNDIDAAIRMLQQNPDVAGAHGMLTRGKELVATTLTGATDTPANDFQSQLLQIQSKWKKLPTVAANRFKADAGQVDNIIKGLGVATNAPIAINSLTQLRDNLTRGLQGSTAPAAGAPQAAAPADGAKAKSKSGKPMTFRNGQWEYD